MTTRMIRKMLMVSGIVAGLMPVYNAQAQNDQNERLDKLFVQDEDGMSREERHEQFARENPELAARIEQRRAEMEARRSGFETKYPEAAAELKTWREQGRTTREQERARRQERRKQFEEKYPEAVAEMKAWREQDKAGHEQRRTEMSERRKQFSEKYPEAATEMKSWRDGPGPRAGFRRHPVQPGFRDGGRD